MQYRRLAKTEMDVSVLSFGCWAIVGGFNWGPQDENDSIAALQAAYEAGVNFYDSAEGYGSGYSEQLLAKALGEVRDQIFIATKASPNNFAPDDLRAACERSLQNLQTDHIDLYQLHWPNREIPIAETLGVLDELKEAGKIRAYGVSNFGPHDLSEALLCEKTISSDQMAYSLLFRAVEHVVQPLCVANEVSILCYSPLMQGLLTGKFATAADVPDDRARTRHFSKERLLAKHEEAGFEAETFAAIEAIGLIAKSVGESPADLSLAWLLARGGVASVIAGARNAEQTQRNVSAAELTLSPDIIAALDEVTHGLKKRLGPNLDMWQSVSRIR